MSNALVRPKETHTPVSVYSSLAPTSGASAAKVYSAISSALSLKDAVNVPLKVVDVIVRTGGVLRDNGTVDEVLITTLITESGQAYASNSETVAGDIRNLIEIMGDPHTKFWGKSLTIVPKLQTSAANRSFITLTLAD